MSSAGPDHAAPRQDQGDKDRRIAYSRESLLSVRPAACRDNKGELAGIDVCKNEVEEALMWESEGSVPPQSSEGSRSKICTRFSSTGCRFGDGCRFLHHIPSSHHEQAAVAKKMSNLNLGRGDPATVKTRLCKNHETREGCKWGDACHFAHGKGELGKPMGPGSSFKTRLCVSFVTSGSCAFGGKCHFAHGEDELRSSDAL